jgi:hypothetical protein
VRGVECECGEIDTGGKRGKGRREDNYELKAGRRRKEGGIKEGGKEGGKVGRREDRASDLWIEGMRDRQIGY